MTNSEATLSRRFLREILRSNFVARRRMASADIFIPSPGCDCQISCTELFGLFIDVLPLLELAGQHGFNAMNFCRHVSGGEARNLRDGSGVEPFQVRKDYMAIERLETLDELKQKIERVISICIRRGIVGQVLQLFQPNERS